MTHWGLFICCETRCCIGYRSKTLRYRSKAPRRNCFEDVSSAARYRKTNPAERRTEARCFKSSQLKTLGEALTCRATNSGIGETGHGHNEISPQPLQWM